MAGSGMKPLMKEIFAFCPGAQLPNSQYPLDENINDAQKKIGTKGVPKSCALTRQEFEEALYDSETVVKRNFSRFQIDKKVGGVALINVTKKSLNAAYSKLYVSDNLVECTPWDSLNK